MTMFKHTMETEIILKINMDYVDDAIKAEIRKWILQNLPNSWGEDDVLINWIEIWNMDESDLPNEIVRK